MTEVPQLWVAIHGGTVCRYTSRIALAIMTPIPNDTCLASVLYQFKISVLVAPKRSFAAPFLLASTGELDAPFVFPNQHCGRKIYHSLSLSRTANTEIAPLRIGTFCKFRRLKEILRISLQTATASNGGTSFIDEAY